MVRNCGTAIRYLVSRADDSEVTFSSAAAAGSATGWPSVFTSAGETSSFGLRRRASSTSRAICNAASSSPAVMLDALTAGSPSRRIAACTTQRISTSTAGIRSIEIAPAQLVQCRDAFARGLNFLAKTVELPGHLCQKLHHGAGSGGARQRTGTLGVGKFREAR